MKGTLGRLARILAAYSVKIISLLFAVSVISFVLVEVLLVEFV